MSVDELLEKLEAEYKKLESELPAAYENYGQAAYQSKITPYDTNQVGARLSRMTEIRAFQEELRIEADRAAQGGKYLWV